MWFHRRRPRTLEFTQILVIPQVSYMALLILIARGFRNSRKPQSQVGRLIVRVEKQNSHLAFTNWFRQELTRWHPHFDHFWRVVGAWIGLPAENVIELHKLLRGLEQAT